MLQGVYFTCLRVCIPIALALVVGAYSYSKGTEHERIRNKVEQANIARDIQKKYERVGQQYEVVKAERDVVARSDRKVVEKIVVRDVYRNVCIDNDGLSVINASINRENPSNTSNAALP